MVEQNYLLSQTLNWGQLVSVYRLGFYEVSVLLLDLIMVDEVCQERQDYNIINSVVYLI